MKENLRIDEAAEELNCSTRTIRRLIESGELLAFNLRHKGSIRIPCEAVKRFIADRIVALAEQNGNDLSVTNMDK